MRIWFNRHFAVVAQVCRLLREAQPPLPLEIVVSHRNGHFIGFSYADFAFLEPGDLGTSDYVNWALGFAQRHSIDVMVPGHHASALVAASDRFAAIGVRLLSAASADILPCLHRKDWVYANAPKGVRVPQYVVVTDAVKLESAVEQIEVAADPCIKPTISVYGFGYHRLISLQRSMKCPPRPDEITLAQWFSRYSTNNKIKPQLVMAYLPGPEYSVDLACQSGQVLAAVQRKKPQTGSGQLLVHIPAIQDAASKLVKAFELSGLINIQFREGEDGQAYLLEINPRASGGIGMSCLSGINLPELVFRALLLDQRPDVPKPRLGLRVAELPQAVILPDTLYETPTEVTTEDLEPYYDIDKVSEG